MIGRKRDLGTRFELNAYVFQAISAKCIADSWVSMERRWMLQLKPSKVGIISNNPSKTWKQPDRPGRSDMGFFFNRESKTKPDIKSSFSF